MVYVVVAEPPHQQAVEDQVALLANGWQRVECGTWIMGSRLRSGSLRDTLMVKVPGASLLVARLQGEWSTTRMTESAAWLLAAKSTF